MIFLFFFKMENDILTYTIIIYIWHLVFIIYEHKLPTHYHQNQHIPKWIFMFGVHPVALRQSHATHMTRYPEASGAQGTRCPYRSLSTTLKHVDIYDKQR